MTAYFLFLCYVACSSENQEACLIGAFSTRALEIASACTQNGNSIDLGGEDVRPSKIVTKMSENTLLFRVCAR